MSSPTLAPRLFHRFRFSKSQVFKAIAVVSAIGVSRFLFWPTLADRIVASNSLPHLYLCLGKPGLVWTYVIAGFLIGLANASGTLAYVVYKARPDMLFGWIFLAFVPFMVACGGVGSGSSDGNVRVSVAPANVTLLSNQKQQFTATVSGASITGVTWSATAGAVDSNGLYTAPAVSSQTSAVVTAASNANSSKLATADVTVSTLPLSITTGSLPPGQQGTPYSEVFTATGGVTPYSWSISAGTPPAGIKMNANGNFAGVPTSVATFNFTALVTDANSETATGNFNVTVFLVQHIHSRGIRQRSWAVAIRSSRKPTTLRAMWPQVRR